jgi:hypothetical protein
MLGQNPKRAPELNATILTGPGVIEDASANAAMEMKILMSYLSTWKNDPVQGTRQAHECIEGNYPIGAGCRCRSQLNVRSL